MSSLRDTAKQKVGTIINADPFIDDEHRETPENAPYPDDADRRKASGRDRWPSLGGGEQR
jgi:hypothetical protein